MKLTPEYIEEEIWVSGTYRYCLDERELMKAILGGYVDIEQTGLFETEFDKLRTARGYKPFFADLPRDQLDLDGWYEMMVAIKDGVATKVIGYATYSNDDDCKPYEIPLDEETGKAVYKKILKEVSNAHKNSGYKPTPEMKRMQLPIGRWHGKEVVCLKISRFPGIGVGRKYSDLLPIEEEKEKHEN